ncbi:MAG: hypothetical protein ACOZCP_13855 [Pseudomonadota bacterium]
MIARAKLLFLVTLVLMLGGCVTTWTRLDQGQVKGPDDKFSVEVPPGWVQFSFNRNSLQITRDGLQIQFIDVALQSPEQQFKRSKKSVGAATLPSELAALVLAELRAGLEPMAVTVLENTPATVAGKPGFKLHVQYRNDRGALFDRLVYGALHEGKVLTFSYHALDTHYFRRDLPVFEKIVASYRQGA